MLLAVLLAATSDTLPRANALKNVVLGIANATAAVAFALLADVDWVAAIPLALGLLAGARLGPVIVRRSDARLLRTIIGLLGLGLAVKLGIDAYGVSGYPGTSTPSASCQTSSKAASRPRSWVMTSTPRRCSRARPASRVSSSSAPAGSRCVVGSSKTRKRASQSSSRAAAIRWR